MHKYLLLLIIVAIGFGCRHTKYVHADQTQTNQTTNTPTTRTDTAQEKPAGGSREALDTACIVTIGPDAQHYKEIMDLYIRARARFPERHEVPLSKKDSSGVTYFGYSVQLMENGLICIPTNKAMTFGIPTILYIYAYRENIYIREQCSKAKGPYYCRADVLSTEKAVVAVLTDLNTWQRPKKITMNTTPTGMEYQYEW